MERLTDNKIVLVTRATRLAELKRRFTTRMQARFYVTHLGGDFADYEREDDHYQHAVARTRTTLESLGRVQVVDRAFLPNFVFGPDDVVVVLGQDGLVANTVKYLDGQPVIGVNPDPARWDGRLLPFRVPEIGKVLREIFQGRRRTQAVTMARATLNTGETLHAVNDLFIGARTHVSARYRITVGDRTEEHSSSGVIVSTGVGATGWYRSLLTGAAGIVGRAAAVAEPGSHAAWETDRSDRWEDPAPLFPELEGGFPWDTDHLRFTVREPFPSRVTQTSLVFGRVTREAPLIVVSEMPENGVIFSDGIEADFLEFRAGVHAAIEVADKQGRLVV